MNTEDLLKGLMGRAGEPDDPTELEWMAFARTARRSLLVHRVVAVAAAAAVLVTGALGGYALMRSDAFERQHPPVDVVPHPLPRRVPRECPEATSYRPASELGAAAFVRDGDLYRVDVETGKEYKLVEGRGVIYSPQVSWSPDGRWIHLGEGVIVPAAGGPVCQPFGLISDAQWVGERLVGIRRGGVVIGVPAETAQAVAAIRFDGDVNSFAVDPSGRRLAAGVRSDFEEGTVEVESTLWTVDLATGEQQRIHRLSQAESPVSAHVVRWSADGEWILYGAPDYPTDAVNAELFALPVDGGTPQPVFDAAPWGLRDQYASCGKGAIVFSAGSGGALGEPDFGKEANELYTAFPPTWDAAKLPAVISDLDESESEFWPDCSPDGTHLAVTGKRGNYSTVLYFPLSGEGSTGAFDTGDGVAEYPLWSTNHSPEQPVILHVRRNGQAAELYLFDGAYHPIASLGNLHPLERSYETMLDWYQP